MAEALEAGVAYLSILAEGSKLQKTTDAAVKKVNAPDIIAKIDAELSGLQKKRQQAEQILNGLREKVVAQADLDIAALEARKKVAEGKLAELSSKKATPQVELQATKLNADLGRINSSLDRLNARRASPEVDAKVAKATSDLSGIDRQITTLNSRRASVQINADGAAAAATQIDAVQGKANRLNGSRASVNIAAAGGAQASGMLGLIVAGLAAVSAAAPAAVAALGAVAGTATALGQAAAAGAAGFSGIGDAIKAVEADEKSAATTSASAASTRTGAANQIASAQAALSAAVTASSRAAVTGAEQTADAERASAQAVLQADRTRITSGQQVAAARRALADAIVAAGERTSAAERAVGRAQESARYAQESLTRARKAAVEANQDLQLSLSGIAISEKRAQLALRKAIAERAGQDTSQMFKTEEMDLDVAEADQNLKEIRERYGDLREEQAQWARGGVNGSEQVVAAQRAVRDANLGVEDSVRSLAQAQRDGARSVQDASIQAAQAQQQAAWSIQDAQAGVADAQRSAARAARDASWAQEDAARGVADAQRGLQQALAATADSAGGAGAAGKKSAYELAQLTPAGRSFVAFWTGEWKPAMQEVTDAVAGELLPRVERGMRNLLGIQPELKDGLAGTGRVLGDVAARGADLATSPAFRASFAQIMASNNRSLASYGNAALSGADSFRILTVAGLPLSERLARMAEGGAQAAESFLLQKESTGELSRAMEFGADKAGQLVSVVLDLAEAGYDVGVAIAPVGEVILDLVSGVARTVGEFAQANQGITQFIVVAGLAVATTNMFAKSIVAIQNSAAIAGGGLRTLWTIMSTGLNPVALSNTQALRGFQSAMATSAPVVGTYAAGLTRSATAGKAAAGVTRAFGSAVRYGAASLPILGVAIAGVVALGDALNTSFEEGVEIFGKGGVAQQKLRAELEANSQSFRDSNDPIYNYLRANVAGIETTESFNSKLAEQRKEWSNLQNAQYDAGIAQGDYEQKVREFGPASKEATDALANLNAKTRDVEIAQIAVREKTDLATAAMLYQRDQALAAIDADLRLRMSKQQLAQDQQALADAIKASGPASKEANDAQLQLEQTQLRTAEAAKSSAGGQRAYVDSIKEMVAQSNGQYTPTLAKMVATLDAAGLAALGAKVGVNELGQTVVTMPDGKTIVVDVNDVPARTGLAGVVYQLGQVPPGKTITVNAMTEPEKQKLIDLGFTVNTLPDGNVQVTANDAMARATLTAFQAFAAWQQANPQLAADPAKSYEAMRGFLADAGKQTGVPMLDADPRKADEQVRGAVDRYNRTWSVMPVDSNTAEADRKSGIAHDFAGRPVTFGIDADTKPAEGAWDRFWGWLNQNSGFAWTQKMLGRPGYADGGVVHAALGGHIQHKQVIRGFPTGGSVRGPGTATSDSIPAMLSDGEYVIRAASVRAVGVPALDAINGMARGGLVGFAAGGSAKAQPAASGAGGGDALSVPTGDAAAAGDAAGATAGLAGAMGLAASAADVLDPALAAVTAQQQQMVTGGVSPLATALTGQLVPAVAAGNTQIGVAAPLAHQALQGAQTATQLSTGATAVNAAANNAAMAGSTMAMSQQAQLEHAGLRAGQVATQITTGQTAGVTAAQNAGMAATTTGMSVAAQLQHAALRAGHGMTQQSNIITAQNTAANDAAMTGSMTGMSMAGQFQHAALRAGHGLTQQSNVALAQNTAGNNVNMEQTTGNMSGTNQNHLAGLRGAQGVTTQATVGFADSWRDQLGRTIPDSEKPLRHVINVPIGGIVGAWNTIDQQFALGKHVPPPVAAFASGGRVPGTGSGDTVPAMLTPGEYVISKPVVKKWGIGNINAAHQAARSGRFPGLEGMFTGDLNPRGFTKVDGFAKGGPVAVTPGGPMGVQYRATGGAIDNAVRVGMSMNGKKYVYGGSGPGGTDCSGMVAYITRALNMDPNPYRRIGTTASFPWGGFTPGRGDWSVGNTPGVHMAGTLNVNGRGVNIESGGAHGTSAFGGPAVGADNSQFPQKFFLPQVGGTFVSGGSGDGGGFDFVGFVRDAFKFVFDEIIKVPQLFGASDQVARGAGIPRVGADLAIDKLIEKLSSMFSGAGGGVPDAALANLIIGIGKGMGFPRKGPEVALATAFQESGLRNINYGDRDSLGVFQQRPSMGWGSPQQIMDPRYSATRFYQALRGVRGWEGMPHTVAAQRVQRSAFPDAYAKWVGRAVQMVSASGIYDNGGPLPDGQMGINLSGKKEWVLDPVETRSYDTLTRIVGRDTGFDLSGGGRDAPVIENLHVTTPRGATLDDAARAMTWEVKKVRRGGVYAGRF